MVVACGWLDSGPVGQCVQWGGMLVMKEGDGSDRIYCE